MLVVRRDEKQSRHHPFINCKACKTQTKDVEKAGTCCEWKHRRAPRVALPPSGERATEAALSFLRDAKVRRAVTTPPRGGEALGEGMQMEKRKAMRQRWVGGRGSRTPQEIVLASVSCYLFWARCGVLFLLSFFLPFLCFSVSFGICFPPQGGDGERRPGSPATTAGLPMALQK